MLAAQPFLYTRLKHFDWDVRVWPESFGEDHRVVLKKYLSSSDLTPAYCLIFSQGKPQSGALVFRKERLTDQMLVDGELPIDEHGRPVSMFYGAYFPQFDGEPLISEAGWETLKQIALARLREIWNVSGTPPVVAMGTNVELESATSRSFPCNVEEVPFPQSDGTKTLPDTEPPIPPQLHSDVPPSPASDPPKILRQVSKVAAAGCVGITLVAIAGCILVVKTCSKFHLHAQHSNPTISVQVQATEVLLKLKAETARLCTIQVDRGHGWNNLTTTRESTFIDGFCHPNKPETWKYRARYDGQQENKNGWGPEVKITVGQ